MKYKVLPLLSICLALTFQTIAQKDSIESLLNKDNDWPALRRFMKENQQLQPPSPEENRVVFMGNSITEGWINLDPAFFKGRPYINRGISGQTTPQMLIRFRQDVIDLQPKVVVILAGINDIAGNTGPSSLQMIKNNIASMAQLAKINNIKVVLCSILPVSSIPWKAEVEPITKIAELNSWLKKYAVENAFEYVDYFSAMADSNKGLPKNLSSDGVHPNKKGYELMAPLVESAIKKALTEK